ncbi:MAG: hypothetical protein WC248_04120 [Candidatus Methanomethylophilaceae archaeon]|jgi:hypothetical protein
MRKDSIGFAYAYNVAGVDPSPYSTAVRKRAEEIKQDYTTADFSRMCSRMADLELRNEELKKLLEKDGK